MYDAKLIGSYERTDIALIKIQGAGFPTVPLGSSKDLDVGEWVAAFGNPFGQGHTMTKGIISAKGRDIGEINKFPMLQTDAPINPGNSGGPLVNMKGQVVGVNSAIDARAQGIGFAIPVDEVKSVLPQLEKNGRLKRAYLGAGLADLNPQAAVALGMEDAQGSVISMVEPGGPADKAGLRPYDIVTEFNGRKVEDSARLRDAVGDAEIGKIVDLKLIRDGKTKKLKVTLAERPEIGRQGSRLAPHPKGVPAPHDFGFTITDPNAAVRKDFGLEEDVKKPVITDVMPGSAAAKAGLLAGDVVLDVNKKDVTNSAEVTKLLTKTGSNTLRISRQGSVLFLVLNGN
jgi:serine protease Do